ncbi:MAG: hydrogenase expression/formation protein HypE [Acidobacteria bacterium]|jgi:hydrogenase expression/formation protein HypE|nr:hydrogenase expression/formation protein HypE [Acidobacteriota bacterium]
MSAPDRDGKILLAHGAGGRLTQELVTNRLMPALDNPFLRPLTDAAVLPELPPGRPALTTDGFVVSPPIFAGGDLGYLAVAGTVNDLAVSGAQPLWLAWALILEEGLPLEMLAVFVDGAARAAREAGVTLVAGDTKVVPRGKGDLAFAVTTGLGVVPPGRELGDGLIRPGDAVLLSGPAGDHGATIMAHRHGLGGEALRSDVAPLGGLVEALLASGARVRAMHDPTRGGVATTCNEVAARAGVRIVLDEAAVPVGDAARAVCEVLGLDPLYVACEGRLLAWVDPADAPRALDALRAHPLGRGAAAVGTVEPYREGPRVVMRTPFGGLRVLDLLSGMDLPRIC